MADKLTKEEKIARYPMTEEFKVIDTIGVPHPYCITPKHLKHCRGMYLDETEIKYAESMGARCNICKGDLSYDEHDTALLISVYERVQSDESKTALQQYLLSIVKMCEEDGYAGFAFVKAEAPHELETADEIDS